MGAGYIVAQIFTSRGAIPIEDAAVSVVRENSAGQELHGIRTTSLSGRTAPIVLAAPDRANSQQPTGAPAFSSYILRVDHPLYQTVVVRDLQIFDGATSLQNVEMIPLQENPTPSSKVELFNVPPQDL